MQEFTAAFREHLYRAKLIIHGSLLVVGVIQVLNKRHGTFERRDQMLLERVADTVGPMLQQIQTAEVGD